MTALRFGFGSVFGGEDEDPGIAAFGQAAASIVPLQVAGSRGEINAIEGSAVTSTNLKQTGRSRHYIGTQDQSELVLCFNGFFVDSATAGNGQTCAEVNATNSYKIKASAEINGTVVQFSFAGAAQGTVPSGSTLYKSDPLYPSAFGLTKFDAQTMIWIKCEREFNVGDKGMFHQTISNNPVISGESYFVGATSATSQLATAGALSTTGGWTQQSHIWLPYCILGRPLHKMMSAVTVGASIENGVGDGQGDGLNGAGGYFRRMLAAVAGKKLARIHLAKSGETAKSFVANSAKRMVMLPYVTHCFSGHGGNDYSTSESLANTETRWAAIWAILKAGSSRYVEHYALSPKTDSPGDAWATLAGQTPRAGYETGGAWRDAGNTWCAGQVAANDNLDGFVDLSGAQVPVTNLDKWRVDLGQPTTDGTHPSAVVAAAMATLAVTHIEALRSAYEA